MSLIGRGSPVLFLDDSEDDRYLLEVCFKKAGFKNKIILFETGSALFDHLIEVEKKTVDWPEALLLDINMPEMDGFEVLRKIRSMPAFADLPVVFFLTNSSSANDKEKANSLGCAYFYTKPSSIDDYVLMFGDLQKRLE